MPGFQSFRRLFTSASSSGARSTVLHPLQWIFASLLIALLAGLWLPAPFWLLVLLGFAVMLVLVAQLLAYLHFARTDPDALRSESYSLQRMAIEHGMVGDSEHGLAQPSSTDLDPGSESIDHESRRQLPSGQEEQ